MDEARAQPVDELLARARAASPNDRIDGIVREVYRVAAWLPAGTTLELDQSRVHPATRFEFVGRIAEASVRDRYRFYSVAHIFPAGDQNPVRYREADSGGATPASNH